MLALSDPRRPDLRSHPGSLLGGSISPARFREWYVEAQPEIEAAGDDDELDLVWAVEHRFAGYTGGHIDAAMLVAAIRDDVAARRAGIPAGGPYRSASIA